MQRLLARIAKYLPHSLQQAGCNRLTMVQMTHLNETIYSTGIASSYQATQTKSGVFINDDMIANVCKHHVTKMPYEIGRLAQDLAGGLVVTLPSDQDLDHPEIGPLIRKYLKGRDDISTEDRMRILRLIENMTLGRNAVGYLTESMHGAGSPQAASALSSAKSPMKRPPAIAVPAAPSQYQNFRWKRLSTRRTLLQHERPVRALTAPGVHHLWPSPCCQAITHSSSVAHLCL